VPPWTALNASALWRNRDQLLWPVPPVRAEPKHSAGCSTPSVAVERPVRDALQPFEAFRLERPATASAAIQSRKPNVRDQSAVVFRLDDSSGSREPTTVTRVRRFSAIRSASLQPAPTTSSSTATIACWHTAQKRGAVLLNMRQSTSGRNMPRGT
jgi:hypothetical protein